MSEWQSAERVQKNDAGQYRALMGGEWVPVEKAQKNDAGQFRVLLSGDTKPEKPALKNEKGFWDKRSLPETKRELALSAVHHVTNIPFGTGQAFSNAAAEAAGLVAPKSDIAKALRERAKLYGEFMKDREASYQASVSDSPASYAGAVAGEVLPFALKPVQAGINAINTGVSKPVSSLVELATRSPRLAKYAGTVAGGAVTAPVVTALAPVTDGDYAEGKKNQLEMATALGAGIPAVGIPAIEAGKFFGRLGKKASSSLTETIKSQYASGQKQLAEAHYAKLAREGGDDAANLTVNALENPRELIGKVTAADAIADANMRSDSRFGGTLVRLHHELASLPETSTKLRGIEKGQEISRKAAVETIAGTSAEKGSAASALEKASQAYDAIKAAPVKSNSTLQSMMNSSAFREAEERAAKTSETLNAVARAEKKPVIPFKVMVDATDKTGKPILNKDGSPKKIPQFSAQGLQDIKEVLDAMADAPTIKSNQGMAGTESRTYRALKNALSNWMDNNVEGWTAARNSYRSAKNTLNRQAAGKELGNILKGPRGEERGGQFINAQRNLPKTLKPVLGKERPIKFIESEEKTLANVTSELNREEEFARMVRETNIPGAVSPVSGSAKALPSPLYRPTMIANWLIKAGVSDADKAVNRIAADIAADPKLAAEIIKKYSPQQRGAIMKALSNFNKFASDKQNITNAIASYEAAKEVNK